MLAAVESKWSLRTRRIAFLAALCFAALACRSQRGSITRAATSDEAGIRVSGRVLDHAGMPMRVMVLLCPLPARYDAVSDPYLGLDTPLHWWDVDGPAFDWATPDFTLALATGVWPEPIRATFSDADGEYSFDDVRGDLVFVRAFVHPSPSGGNPVIGTSCGFPGAMGEKCSHLERNCKRWASLDAATGERRRTLRVDFDPRDENVQLVTIAGMSADEDYGRFLEVCLGERWFVMPMCVSDDYEQRVGDGHFLLGPLPPAVYRIHVGKGWGYTVSGCIAVGGDGSDRSLNEAGLGHWISPHVTFVPSSDPITLDMTCRELSY
ncbi:MAG: hypothetical protein EPO68_08900 [Planctomycetota bacterium]|nr:MAG: hypothetical protein EPO68_08900 [Planctomycetota bacterium]